MGGLRDIRNNRGASIIIALVFLLICTVIAAVIIGAASANAERSKTHAQEQQAYFAVNSAIGEAKNMFSTTEPMKTLKLTGTSSEGALSVTPSTYAGTQIANWAATQAQYVFAHKATYADGSNDLNVNVQASSPVSGAADIPDVKLTYSMDRYYAITVKAQLVDQTLYAYTLTTKIPPTTTGFSVDSTTGAITYDISTTNPFTVTWGQAGASSNAEQDYADASKLYAVIAGSGTVEKMTTTLLKAYINTYGYELSQPEQALSTVVSTHPNSYGWKPMLTSDAQLYLAACTSYSTYGTATDIALIYRDGHYYKLTDGTGADGSKTIGVGKLSSTAITDGGKFSGYTLVEVWL